METHHPSTKAGTDRLTWKPGFILLIYIILFLILILLGQNVSART